MGECCKKVQGRVRESISGKFGGHFSQLPEGIFLDILSRLQFSDLKRCRVVRKSWYQTIPSPYFSKLHHAKSVSRGTYLVSYILQQFMDLHLLEISYSTESNAYVFDVIPLKTDFTDMDIDYGVVGSCNGLLCLCEPFLADPVYICNPLIGEYITLPLSNDITDELILSGFGFDKTTGDYKVIRMTCRRVVLNDVEIHRDIEAEVYTLGSKNWRKIGAVPFLPRATDMPGVFLNGVIHWMSESWNIVCFDIASEKFSVLKFHPVYGNAETASGTTSVDFPGVHVIRGHLCVLDYSLRQRSVWVMKKYGDDQSWFKEGLFDGFYLEFVVVSNISHDFPHLMDLCPHVISFISHMNPKEETSGGEEGSLNSEEWSKTLTPIPSGPRPNGEAVAIANAEYGDPQELGGPLPDAGLENGDPEEMRPAELLSVLRLLNL